MNNKKNLLKNELNNLLPNFIELETSTYCNRKCFWCPNSKYKRGQIQKYISYELFDKIISDLKELNYSGQIALHNYNEPLLDIHLYRHIAAIKKNLDKAKILIFTNGDFLNEIECKKLEQSGVSALYISLHDAINSPEPQKLILKHMGKINQKGPLNEISDEFGQKFEIFLGNMQIVYYIPHKKMLTSRGGIISDNNAKDGKNSFCFLPFSSSAIDFEGNVKICCEIYPEHDLHRKNGIVGNLAEKSFKELWFFTFYDNFRKDTLLNKVDNGICLYCPKNSIYFNKEKMDTWKKYLKV